MFRLTYILKIILSKLNISYNKLYNLSKQNLSSKTVQLGQTSVLSCIEFIRNGTICVILTELSVPFCDNQENGILNIFNILEKCLNHTINNNIVKFFFFVYFWTVNIFHKQFFFTYQVFLSWKVFMFYNLSLLLKLFT